VQDDFDRAYEEHSKYADMSVFGETSDDPRLRESPWDLERLSSTASWISEQIPHRGLRVLDAGCATGTLIGIMQELGFSNLVGLEPSPLAVATTKKHYDVEAFVGSFCSPPTEIGEFDLIVLSHVLEHVVDVKAAADGLTSMLRPDGLVYIEVPDASRYQDFLVAPFHDFNNEHINHFSLSCLDTLLGARGFERVIGGSKEVPIAPGVLYPAAYGLWKKSSRLTRELDFDHGLRNSLDAYIARSHELMSRLDSWIDQHLAEGPIALWGAGNLTFKLLVSTALARRDIRFIVDGSTQRQGITMSGIVVSDPASLTNFSGDILIMSLHHAESIRVAARQLLGNRSGIHSLMN
jgi:SAM-dependent methyltransferase